MRLVNYHTGNTVFIALLPEQLRYISGVLNIHKNELFDRYAFVFIKPLQNHFNELPNFARNFLKNLEVYRGFILEADDE